MAQYTSNSVMSECLERGQPVIDVRNGNDFDMSRSFACISLWLCLRPSVPTLNGHSLVDIKRQFAAFIDTLGCVKYAFQLTTFFAPSLWVVAW